MSVLQSRAMVNLTDATVAEAVYVAVNGAEDSALRGVCMGAIFIKLKGDGKASRATLFLALRGKDGERLAEATANNYATKCAAAAQPDHFPWAIDPNRALDDITDDIMPEFKAYWHAVRDVRKSGPDTAEKRDAMKTKRDKAKAEKDAKAAEDAALLETLQAQASRKPTPMEIADAFLGALAHTYEATDGTERFSLDAAALISIKAAIEGEIARRKPEVEQIAA